MTMNLMYDTDLKFAGVYLLEENQYQGPQHVFTSHSKFQKLNQR